MPLPMELLSRDKRRLDLTLAAIGIPDPSEQPCESAAYRPLPSGHIPQPKSRVVHGYLLILTNHGATPAKIAAMSADPVCNVAAHSDPPEMRG